MAQAEHRPPHLHVDHQQHGSPKERKPIGANAIAMPDDPSNRSQDLGEPQTNNDRQKNRQVCEGVHGSIGHEELGAT